MKQITQTLRLAIAPISALLIGLISQIALAESSSGWSALNMPEGVTQVSRDVYGLHMLIFWICVVISILVYGLMAWSLYKYRKSQGAVSADFHDNVKLEWSWTILAALLLVLMAIPSTKVLVDIYDHSPGEINIEVTGYQWKWQYKYREDEVEFFSSLRTDWDEIENRLDKGEHYLLEVDKAIYVPINTRISFLVTANDVLHSFWVPDLAVKIDAIPGYYNRMSTTIEEEGVYSGVCAELCGRNHGFMPIVINAVSQEKYDAWILEQKAELAAQRELFEKDWSVDELMARGSDVYGANCSACHQANGQGLPGAFPALVNSPLVLGSVDEQVDLLIQGVPGTAMQAFGEQLNPIDLAAVITYTRRSWGNESQSGSDFPKPADIARRLESSQ